MRKRRSLVCIAAALAALFGASGADQQAAHAQVGPPGRLGAQAYETRHFSSRGGRFTTGRAGPRLDRIEFRGRRFGIHGFVFDAGRKDSSV